MFSRNQKMKITVGIYKSNDQSDTDDECVKVGIVDIDSSASIDELLDAARLLSPTQDDLETLNRMVFYRQEDGTEF